MYAIIRFQSLDEEIITLNRVGCMKKKTLFYILIFIIILPTIYLVIYSLGYKTTYKNTYVKQIYNQTFDFLKDSRDRFDEFEELSNSLLKEIDKKIKDFKASHKSLKFQYQKLFSGFENFQSGDLRFPIFFHKDTYNDYTKLLFPTIERNINQYFHVFNIFPVYYLSNPIIDSIYFISKDKFSLFYPNNELIDKFSNNNDIVEKEYFTLSTPKNNSEKEVKFAGIFEDDYSKYLVASYVKPFYINNMFTGSLGVDIDIKSVEQRFISYVKMHSSALCFILDKRNNFYGYSSEMMSIFDVNRKKESEKLNLNDITLDRKPYILEQLINESLGEIPIKIDDEEYVFLFVKYKDTGVKFCCLFSENEARHEFVESNIYKKISSPLFFISIFTLAIAILLLLVFLVISLFQIKNDSRIINDYIDDKETSEELLLSKDSFLFEIGRKIEEIKKGTNISDWSRKQSDKTSDKLDSKDISSTFNDGIKFLESNELSSAQKCFSHVIQYEPENYKALINLGLVYFKNKEYQKAINLWEKALKIKPDLERVKKNLEKLKKIVEEE